jgi:ribosomal protein S18 acetylase RimI-like enzyme
MGYEFPSVAEYGLERAAEVLSRGFANYLVPIVSNAGVLLSMARVDSVDLTVSRVFVRDGAAIGGALVARRGWTCRLAGMAIVPEARRAGAGRAGVARLLAEAKARGERDMVLEVIEQNEPAVKLYEACSFKKVRRLVGFAGPGVPDTTVPPGLMEVDLRDMAEVVTHDSLRDLPWQLSGETLAQLTPPCVAFRLNGSWVALSNPAGVQITIRGLITEHAVQGQGRVATLLRAVMAKFPGKEWRIGALWPEELGPVIADAGLARTPLSQWQMERMV